MSETPITADEILADDAFDEWLSTGTLARRAVEIYNNPDLAAEYDVLAMRLAEAQAAAPQDAEASIGDNDPVAAVLAEMEALHEKWQASKAVWIERAVEEHESKAIVDEVPEPPIPALLSGDKPEPGSPEHEARLAAGQAYLAERERVITERNLRLIALATVEVRTARGVVKRVTVEQVRRLRGRPHGKQQTQRLIEAIESATSGDVEVPRPTLPGRSSGDRG